jgi:hypothetical protein
VLLGGDDLDRRIMRRLMHHFGAEALLRGGQTFPYEVVNLLRDWQTMPELSRPQYRATLERLERDSTRPDAIRALRQLVSRNLGFTLFRHIEQTKKSLSSNWLARLDLACEELDIHELMTRVAFEELIEDDVARAEAAVRAVLDDAALAPADVSVVLRTGGSSLVPAFVAMLAGIFGSGKLREMDPLVSVVGGLAVAAQRAAGWRPACADRYASPEDPIVRRALARSERALEVSELRVDGTCYSDNRTFVITRVPLALAGLPTIRTSAADRQAHWQTFLRFYIDRPARVYVAYEDGATHLPDWLQSFEPEEMRIQAVQDGVLIDYGLYGRDFVPGKVMLGGNQAPGYNGSPNANYFVIVRSQVEQREEQVAL